MQWYEGRSPGLGLDFARLICATLARIERAPIQFPDVDRGTRRAVMRRFPYAAYFLVETNRVSVLAIFHHRRDPARWQSRR